MKKGIMVGVKLKFYIYLRLNACRSKTQKSKNKEE